MPETMRRLASAAASWRCVDWLIFAATSCVACASCPAPLPAARSKPGCFASCAFAAAVAEASPVSAPRAPSTAAVAPPRLVARPRAACFCSVCWRLSAASSRVRAAAAWRAARRRASAASTSPEA
ncbi:hypothetical protein [Methylobacterium sp. WSM2598]|uniref:hypothetical protein n=1 Tax=Methylobacterium sp. WSM2598 TaxID=398261 RepID=UPI001AEBD95E|nr:hypothetical protein [Methylobacterium sp. WSM2598]